MPTLDIYNQEGQKVDTLVLSDEVFNVEVNNHLLWLVVKSQLAARRAGTHATKTRGFVSGGTKKPYRQKGTGWARQGSRRAPNHVGGGTVFGPHPRKYTMSIPKKVRKNALISALSLKFKENNIVLLDSLDIGEIKTKKVVSLVNRFDAKKALIIENEDNHNFVLSVRNLQEHKWLPSKAANVYDILNHDRVLMTAKTAKELEERLSTK